MRLALVTAMTLLAAPAFADYCGHTAPHRLSAQLGDAKSIVVVGRAGSLRVHGSPTKTVAATGTACASDRDLLAEIKVIARREGSALHIEAVIPERMSLLGWTEARLDLDVTVPDSLPLRVVDGSGEASIRGVASLEVNDGSGDLQIRDVRGDVALTDGSGSVEVEGVGGSVTVRADGSGSLDIRNVSRDVTIEVDGSGGIDVADVRGNFTVERDGSGGVDHDRVAGTVRIPTKD